MIKLKLLAIFAFLYWKFDWLVEVVENYIELIGGRNADIHNLGVIVLMMFLGGLLTVIVVGFCWGITQDEGYY